MSKLQFRAQDPDGEWCESKDCGSLSDFFYGLEDGQLDGETLEQKVQFTDGGSGWVNVNHMLVHKYE